MKTIDVDVLLAQMQEYYEKRAKEANMTGDRVVCVTWHDAVILIKNAPTVDAEPVRHGKWMVTPVYIKCSACGESFMLIPQNYCPHCGAKMDETKDEYVTLHHEDIHFIDEDAEKAFYESLVEREKE